MSETADGLARAVTAFAEPLSDRERQVLHAMAWAACDPLTRLSLTDSATLFTDQERQLLDALDEPA